MVKAVTSEMDLSLMVTANISGLDVSLTFGTKQNAHELLNFVSHVIGIRF